VSFHLRRRVSERLLVCAAAARRGVGLTLAEADHLLEVIPRRLAVQSPSGVEEGLESRSSEQGQDYESITHCRDAMPVELLKLHKKL
jgi:hypothetical protein